MRIVRIVLLSVFVAALIGAPLAAEKSRKEAREEMIAELIASLDSEVLSRAVMTAIFEVITQQSAATEERMKRASPEEREQWKEASEIEKKRSQQLMERALLQIDRAKFAEEIYHDVLDETFSDDELKELVVLSKTPAGQKLFTSLAQASTVAFVRGSRAIVESIFAAGHDLVKEDNATTPKWKQTMADLRSLATSVEARAVDYDQYPDAKGIKELAAMISPTYIHTAPLKDAWDNEYHYEISTDRMNYRFASAGEDGVFDWGTRGIGNAGYDATAQATSDPKSDIVYQNGEFIRYPKDAKENDK